MGEVQRSCCDVGTRAIDGRIGMCYIFLCLYLNLGLCCAFQDQDSWSAEISDSGREYKVRRVGQNHKHTSYETVRIASNFPATTSYIHSVGQNRIYNYIYTVCLVISKPKIPYVHRIYMVLATLYIHRAYVFMYGIATLQVSRATVLQLALQ
jgi:hypothetical protein